MLATIAVSRDSASDSGLARAGDTVDPPAYIGGLVVGQQERRTTESISMLESIMSRYR